MTLSVFLELEMSNILHEYFALIFEICSTFIWNIFTVKRWTLHPQYKPVHKEIS